MMDVESYCKNLAFELGEWKARIDHIVGRFDSTATGDKSPVVSYVNDLHIFLEDLSNRIERLRTECPVAWTSEEIEKMPESHFQKEWRGVWEDVSPGQIGG